MPRPNGSMGETKLKILAVIQRNGASHGYDIWKTLRGRFHCYLDDQSLRNVYHHLRDLTELGLVERSLRQENTDAPKNHPYKLTDKGRTLEEKFGKYLDIL